MPVVPEDYVHGYQSYVCLFSPEKPDVFNVDGLCEKRNKMMMKLEEVGIATRQGTHAVILQDYYANKYGIRSTDFPNAYLADHLSLTLPLYPQMTKDEQNFVCENITKMSI